MTRRVRSDRFAEAIQDALSTPRAREMERIRAAAIVNGRRERREQGIPELIESAPGMTARLAVLLNDTGGRSD